MRPAGRLPAAGIEARRHVESSASPAPRSQLALMTAQLPDAIVHPTENAEPGETEMEPITIFDLEDALDDVDSAAFRIHDWQVEQLCRLGMPRGLDRKSVV